MYLVILRKTYDTRVKYLVMKGLWPDLYRKQIHPPAGGEDQAP
ncbi:hypothetical protein BH10BAC4_BH10BAC4_22160 [soil metagenome]